MAGKAHLDPRRFYRLEGPSRGGEVRFQVVVAQTDLLVVARRDLSREVEAEVVRLRGQIASWGLVQPEFLTSFSPVAAPEHAPLIVRRMAEGATACGVGPMAAVAGTIAQMVCEALRAESPDILVENGGDVYAVSTRERVIGLLAIPEEGVSLGVRVPASEFPVSFCGSSGRIGHSVSFGQGDLVVARAKSGALADAAATALANRLKEKGDLDRVVEAARKFQDVGLDGVFAQCGGKIAVWGRMELAAL